jgi:ATP-dependent DNA ligase
LCGPDPGGSRPYLGASLLAYYDPDGTLVYAGRVGTGINTAQGQGNHGKK